MRTRSEATRTGVRFWSSSSCLSTELPRRPGAHDRFRGHGACRCASPWAIEGAPARPCATSALPRNGIVNLSVPPAARRSPRCRDSRAASGLACTRVSTSADRVVQSADGRVLRTIGQWADCSDRCSAGVWLGSQHPRDRKTAMQTIDDASRVRIQRGRDCERDPLHGSAGPLSASRLLRPSP
jgi:hypothetical protein